MTRLEMTGGLCHVTASDSAVNYMMAWKNNIDSDTSFPSCTQHFHVPQGDESPHSQQPWLLDQSHLRSNLVSTKLSGRDPHPKKIHFFGNALPSHLQAGMTHVSCKATVIECHASRTSEELQVVKSWTSWSQVIFFENLLFGLSVQNKGRKHQLQTSNPPSPQRCMHLARRFRD